MGYDPILDTELLPGKPITSSLLTRLRDNPEATYIGGAGAPSILRLAISSGGTGTDGGWTNSTSLTGMGYYEPTTIVRSSSWSLPGVVVARANGNVTISSTLTVASLSAIEINAAIQHLRATAGPNGGNGSSAGGGGGAHVGAGGYGIDNGGSSVTAGGTARAVSGLWRDWLALNPKLGGAGGTGENGIGTKAGGNGGGCLILLIEGDANFTGATINADGAAGTSSSGVKDAGGGGAGGSIVIICTGTLTSGTFTARGGNGGTNFGGGGGGGGRIALIASAFAGSRTKTVTAGTSNGGTAPGDGQADEYVLTAAQIRGLLFRSF